MSIHEKLPPSLERRGAGLVLWVCAAWTGYVAAAAFTVLLLRGAMLCVFTNA